MGRKSRLQRFDEKAAYQEVIKEFKDMMKPNPETGENCISISKLALWYLNQRRTIESLKDKIENQKYHLKKLEHQKKYYKALNRELNLNALLGTTDIWFRSTPPYFRRKDDE